MTNGMPKLATFYSVALARKCSIGCIAIRKLASFGRSWSKCMRDSKTRERNTMFMMFVLSSLLESWMLGLILIMLNLVRNLNLQLSIFPTIQKPDNRQSVVLTMVGFTDSLRPEKCTGVNFKI